MRPATYVAAHRVYHADTCRPLVAAARRGEVRLVARARGAYPGERLPAGALVGLRSVGFWDARAEQHWGLPLHRNEGIEFTYLATGRLAFEADGRAFDLRPGDLTVTRPWQPHRVGRPHVGIGRLYWVILDVGIRRPHQPWRWPAWIVLAQEDLKRLTHLLRRCERPVWPAPTLAARFEGIGRLLEAEDTAGLRESRLAVELNALLVDVLQMLQSQPVPDDPRLTSAERATALFLDELEHTLDQPWTLARMAEAAGLKRTRFAFYVRRLRNMTPMRHLTARRIERARRLLRERPDLSITDIALECGFSSSQYFATVFRRFVGRAPRQEREHPVPGHRHRGL
ncbi:MAG: AraC family transcriptional regulator [Kiritimatiellae bacterium]|nr:AraC family transcriptional regulator [Kiritimatiellia bacterium]